MFTPTRDAGLVRLSNFTPLAGREYARRRNSDLGQGQHENVSCLSPYIRRRLITEREVVDKVLSHHSNAQSEKFIQEVFWRTYFKGWLEHRPHVWSRYQTGLLTALEHVNNNSALQAGYEAAVSGRTGIDCVDSWARELLETGYLHNHARMWFASIWIFTLRLPWELGADFFLRHLLDGDPASNTLSWRWVGGLHTKGKTYLARPDNIARFTDGRFNPKGQLSGIAEPLNEPEFDLPDQNLPQTQALPQDDFLLLIHEDDCHPESLLPETLKPASIIGAYSAKFWSPLSLDPKVSAFSRAAIKGAAARADTAGTSLAGALIEGDWAEPLIQACEARGLKNIVMAYAPTGPTAKAAAQAKPLLTQAGLTLTQIVRPWDRLTWPYANRGFFKVKKKIPKILMDLQMNDKQGQLL